MNADARHGSLRSKRRLPAKFHSNRPMPDLLKIRAVRTRAADSALSIPKSRRTIVTAQRSSNSRFFTDCYPISAAITPRLDQIRSRLRREARRYFTSKNIIKHSISVAWLAILEFVAQPRKRLRWIRRSLQWGRNCNNSQLFCRRRKAGISKWSSPWGGDTTGAGRPWLSKPCGAGRLAYSDTGS